MEIRFLILEKQNLLIFQVRCTYPHVSKIMPWAVHAFGTYCVPGGTFTAVMTLLVSILSKMFAIPYIKEANIVSFRWDIIF